MPRPTLTRDRIVSAGVHIVESAGFGALTLRSVARNVNATVIGVQRQIGPTELVQAVAAEILATMPRLPPRGDWRRRVRLWALDIRAWLIGCPGTARYLMANRWDVEIALDRIEQAAGLVTDAGLSVADAVHGVRAIYWYILTSSEMDESAPVLAAAFTTETVLRSSERWPRLSSVAVAFTVSEANAQFMAGLDLMLEGIERKASQGTDRVDAGRIGATGN